jgi:hypothetical protein
MACQCHEPVVLAKAIVGLRIGGVAITWEEALALAHAIIQRMHAPQKGT